MECKLKVDSSSNVVAKGYIVATSGLIHGRELGKLNYKVSVDHVNDETARLPIPVPEEMSLVVHASGSIVAWPKNLIIFDDLEVLN